MAEQEYAEPKPLECGDPDTLTLLDDGTLDTVVQCDVCGKEERFSEVERDDDGSITAFGMTYMEETHGEF